MRTRGLVPFFFASLLLGGYLLLGIREPARAASAPLRDLTLFSEAFHIIRTHYFDTAAIDSHNLVEAAIEGMLDRLDDHTHYLPPQAASELTVETEGEFGGLGIVIGIEEGELTVISPIEGTPAWEAGLQAGDKVLEIGDTTTEGMALPMAVSLLRGPVGTNVTIQIRRAGTPAPFAVTLTRATIQPDSVKGTVLSDGIAYLRISSFTERTAEELDSAWGRLARENPRGIILDLRDNPGGVLNAGVAVADRFLETGVIVEIRSRTAEMNRIYLASRSPTFPNLPLAVLVSRGSASASEIVAGAVRDQRRGRLFGQRTFGKGSVQSVLSLSDNSSIAITSAKYFTPSGVSIHGTGITPDVTVETEPWSDTEMLAARYLETVRSFREFGRRNERYTEADLDGFARILADTGLVVGRRPLSRIVAGEIVRHHSTLLLFPDLDRGLEAAIRWLRAEIDRSRLPAAA